MLNKVVIFAVQFVEFIDGNGPIAQLVRAADS